MVVIKGKKEGPIIYETPQDLFNTLNKEFEFTLDPCCVKENAKCKKYFTEKEDGLSQDWGKDLVFMNPPYGRDIKKWIKKAYDESKKETIIVCLLYSATETNYWHDYIMKSKEIRFIKQRLSFKKLNEQKANPCMYPSCVVIFDGHNYKHPNIKSINLKGEEL